MPPSIRQQLLDWASQNNESVLADWKSRYERDVADGSTDETFEKFSEYASYITFEKEQANAEDIARLEQTCGRTFPDSLKVLWTELGQIGGNVKEMDLQFDVCSVNQWLDCFAADAKKWEKLSGLGICDVMNWSWGNDKTIFTIQDGQFIENEDGTRTTYADFANLNKTYTCFCVMTDGGAEDRMYLHFDRDGRFGATRWHQDDCVPMQPDYVGDEDAEELILRCLNGYDAIRKRDPEDPYFCVEDLAKILPQG